MPYITTTCDGTWVQWCDTSATNTATTITPINTTGVWGTWVRNDTIITTATTSVWECWCNTTNSTITQTYRERHMVPRVLSEAEQQERQRVQAEWEAREAESRAKRQAAEKRAEELLVENLSLRQRNEYIKHKHFVVHGREHRYRIRKGRTGNIDVVARNGKVLHRLCAHPGESVPDCDTMLAQKLWLEHREEEFVRGANIHQAPAALVLEALH